MENLRVTLIQAALHWENHQANLHQFTALVEPHAGKTDLIVLPEMFTTGFSMNAVELAEGMDGPTMKWLQQMAKQTNAALTGSFIARENGRFYNRLVWMRPDGSFDLYDKRHLFTLAGEHHAYAAGGQRLITEWKGWKICPLICYDLRFPVWSRNTVDYDLLIYVANFPARRSYAWKNLLVARAIENQCYTIGVNRIGTDGNGFYYSGDSVLHDYEGQILGQMAHLENHFTATLSYAAQQEFRKKFQFLADRDTFFVE